jgi:hypothetical protein
LGNSVQIFKKIRRESDVMMIRRDAPLGGWPGEQWHERWTRRTGREPDLSVLASQIARMNGNEAKPDRLEACLALSKKIVR